MKKATILTNVIISIMLISLAVAAFYPNALIVAKADGRVIYYGNEGKPNVSFMINVYENGDNVREILGILDMFNVKATFFIGGCWATKNIALVKEIYSRGHELGNHGFYHKDQEGMTEEENRQEIKVCHDLIKQNIGVEMTLFALPSGAYDKTTVDVAESLGYKVIMWTHDTIDWRDQDADLIYKRATKDLSNGDLILMHPTKKTVEALSNIISTAINSGFTPTTVSNCL